MSTTGHQNDRGSAPHDVAARLSDAGFVRFVTAATGDAVAATALLVRALDARDIPSQTTVAAIPTATDRATDADCTVAVGRPESEATHDIGQGHRPASQTALAVATDLATEADDENASATLAGAGLACAPATAPAPAETDNAVDTGTAQTASDDHLETALAASDLVRRPGVGVPTPDLVDGLAHSTLVHAPFSGSVERTRTLLADLDLCAPPADGDERADAGTEDGTTVDRSALEDSDRRRVAATVALAVTGDGAAVPGGATGVECLLNPVVGGPFETLAGYGDVLDAMARERPTAALELALGGDVEDPLATWRDHATVAHAALRQAETSRYDGLVVAHCDESSPLGTVARLLATYRSPEPVTVTVGDHTASAVARTVRGDRTQRTTDLGAAFETAAAAADGEGGGTATRARATFDDPETFVDATMEAL